MLSVWLGAVILLEISLINAIILLFFVFSPHK